MSCAHTTLVMFTVVCAQRKNHEVRSASKMLASTSCPVQETLEKTREGASDNIRPIARPMGSEKPSGVRLWACGSDEVRRWQSLAVRHSLAS